MFASRRHGRIDLGPEQSEIWMLDSPLRPIRLVNISSGGLCVELAQPLLLGMVCDMMLDVKRFSNGPGLVNVIVRWRRPVGDQWQCGMEILAGDQFPVNPAPSHRVNNTDGVTAELRPWSLPKRSTTDSARFVEHKPPLVLRTLSS